jgi:hypothetical protein
MCKPPSIKRVTVEKVALHYSLSAQSKCSICTWAPYCSANFMIVPISISYSNA